MCQIFISWFEFPYETATNASVHIPPLRQWRENSLFSPAPVKCGNKNPQCDICHFHNFLIVLDMAERREADGKFKFLVGVFLVQKV